MNNSDKSGYIKLLFFVISFSILVVSCARQAAPTGGPKDEDPPVPLKSKPINYSTNFVEEKIIVQFDEFIVLKDINQELLISPPLPEKPEVKLRGKNLIVKLNNELLDSTTYNLNFYDAIVDLNEGNLLKNFQFEFSTGNEFDSLYLGGIVQNAFDLRVEPKLKVMLYDKWHDTLPRTTIPNYVAKTDEDGHFFISNLKNKPYYIVGLNDMNNNLLFDLPNEGIAFLDSTFKPGYQEITITDTFRIVEEISEEKADTIFRDSIVYRNEWVTTIDDIRLLMFVEDFEPQYFNLSYRFERQQVIFAFNRDLNDSISIFPINDVNIKEDWFIQETHTTKDSLVYWIKDSVLYNIDSLQFQLNYTMKDSNMEDYIQTDTLLVMFEEKKIVEKNKKKSGKKPGRFNLGALLSGNEEEIDTVVVIPSELSFENNLVGMQDLNKEFELISRFPLEKWDINLFEFYYIEDDTNYYKVDYQFYQDTLDIRKFVLAFDKEDEESYELTIPQGAITDIYGNTNDSLNYKISTQNLDFYANIHLNLINVKEHSIIQLLDDKETLFEERSISGDTTLHFEYLHPKKMIFKLFYDKNENSIWDTGDLGERRQAEPVFYFIEAPELKGNMDFEWDWDLYPVPPDNNLGETIIIIPENEEAEHKNHEEHNQ